MNAYDPKTTVATIVADRPSRSRFFERLGVDYCCGGNKPIDEVCAERGLDAKSVLDALTAFEASSDEPNNGNDLRNLSTRELAEHIVSHHHSYLRRELPRLAALSTRVVQAHGDHEPRLAQVQDELGTLRSELEHHIDREERLLFSQLGGDSPQPQALSPVIAELEEEHRGTGDALRRIRELTDTYAVPEWACNTFRAFYDGLRELEADVHEHVHEENNILFPRILGSAPLTHS